MSIDITVITTTSRIANANGDNGYGWVHLRPNQAFQYNDGVGTVEVGTQTVSIEVRDGQLQSALTLHPTRNASNNPDTFYVVTYDIDGERWTEYFTLSTTPTSIEWGAVTRIVPGGSAAADILDQILVLPNPLPQYVRFDESTDADPGAATATARGESFLVRVALATGKIAKGLLNLASLPNVTASKILGRRSTGAGDAEELTVGGGLEVSSTTLQIADLGVTQGKIANDAVTAGKLAHHTTYGVMGYNATGEPGAALVYAEQIGALAVETAKIDNLAVTAGKLGALAVETAKIDNLAVTAGKLGAAAVIAGKLKVATSAAKSIDFSSGTLLNGADGGTPDSTGMHTSTVTFSRPADVPSGAIPLAVFDNTGSSTLIVSWSTAGNIATETIVVNVWAPQSFTATIGVQVTYIEAT